MGVFRRTPAPVVAAAVAVKPTAQQQRWRAKPAKYGASRAITASAERIKLGSGQLDRQYAIWQTEAWTGYERIGEIHYGFNLVANILSRVRLYAAAIVGAEEAPMEAGDAAKEGKLNREIATAAQEAMDELTKTNFVSQIRAFSTNMSVAGECYLVNLPTGEQDEVGDEKKEWVIKSTDEIQVRPTGPYLVPIRGAAAEQRELPADTYIARIWRQHPRYSREPDSSMLAVADPVEELLMLQRLVRSATRSRLNAGLLFVPDGITASSATVTPDPVIDEPLDTELPLPAVADPGSVFLAELMDAMVTPVSDEGSASAVVPMLATGPGELGNQIVHKTFERSSDEWLVNRSERALERILQGIDVPKEIVTGLAQVKYSNAIQITDDLYKANIEPLALVLADSLTAVYLRPVLMARGFDEADVERVTVWYDPSEIVTRPNAADDATQGFDRYLLSPNAWRRENGFGENDAPTEADLALMLLFSKGQLPEDVTASLLTLALPKVLGDEREKAVDNSVVPFPKSARDLLAPQKTSETAEISQSAQGE